MTEKQYYRKQNNCEYYLIQSDFHLYMLDEIIVLLNNYHQENKRLKKENGELKQSDTNADLETQIVKLHEENQRYKRIIDRQEMRIAELEMEDEE